MNSKNILTANIILFLIILILHLIRIMTNFEVKFLGYDVPLYVNYMALLIALVFIYFNYKALKQ